jgi:hypothetical protein
MERHRTDPLLCFKPNRAQLGVMKSDKPFKAINGINQGGKTTVQCVEIAHALKMTHPYRFNYPKQRGVIVVNSRRQASNVFGRYLLKESKLRGPASSVPFFGENEVDVLWDKGAQPYYPKVITHRKSGSEVQFILAGAAQAEKRFRGEQYDWACIDEDAANQALYDELLPRLLAALDDPERPGAGWVLWGVTEVSINLAMEGFMDRCRDPDNDSHEMFTLLPEDSIAVSQNARDIMNSSLSDKARRIRSQGTASAKDFVTIYPVLKDRARYIRTEPYVPFDNDNYWVGYDPGVDHPSGILLAAQNYQNPLKLHLLRFICQTRMPIGYELDLIRDWLNGRRLSGFVIDPCGGGKTEKGTGKSIRQQIAERLWEDSWWLDKPYFPRVNPRHEAGISMVREYLEPSLEDDPLISIDLPTKDNGLDVFMSQMLNYRGNESKHFTGPDGVIKKNDEACDCIRYLIQANPRWIDHGLNVGGPVVEKVDAERPETQRRQMSRNLSRRHKRRRRSVFR